MRFLEAPVDFQNLHHLPHRGTHTVDGAGRLIQVVDAATNTTETYVWNADGTLASFPGPGYTRLLEYDEEGRLVRIRRDYGGGNVQLAYEYGYGFDGGRRWRKDYLNGVWTRYPCGVACGAGDLVEQQKPLDGGRWTVSALYLQGISLVRRNNEWHHFDPSGTAQVITNSSAQVVSNNLYDVFGVLRHPQGSAQTPWRWRTTRLSAEGFVISGGLAALPRTAVFSSGFAFPQVVKPGIGIGISIGPVLCIHRAYRDAMRDNCLGNTIVTDVGAVRHCYICCRIVRCTLGLGPNLAYWLQVLWELSQGEGWGSFVNWDTQTCVLGIGIGYLFWQSCYTGCIEPFRYRRSSVRPFVTPAVGPGF